MSHCGHANPLPMDGAWLAVAQAASSSHLIITIFPEKNP